MSQVYQRHTLVVPCLEQSTAQMPSCKNFVTLRGICFCRRHAEADTIHLFMPVCDRLCLKALLGMLQQLVTALVQDLLQLMSLPDNGANDA